MENTVKFEEISNKVGKFFKKAGNSVRFNKMRRRTISFEKIVDNKVKRKC